MKLTHVLLLSILLAVTPFSCIDSDNQSVEWYITNLYAHTESNQSSAVFDFLSPNGTVFKRSSDPSLTPMIRTLKQINDKASSDAQDSFVSIWNDQEAFIHGGSVEEKTNGTKAHAKGFLAFNKTQGILMNHSLPRFPIRNRNLLLEKFADNFGSNMQHFYCQTFPRSHLTAILEALLTAEPNFVYNYKQTNFELSSKEIKLLNSVFDSSVAPKTNSTVSFLQVSAEGIARNDKKKTDNTLKVHKKIRKLSENTIKKHKKMAEAFILRAVLDYFKTKEGKMINNIFVIGVQDKLKSFQNTAFKVGIKKGNNFVEEETVKTVRDRVITGTIVKDIVSYLRTIEGRALETKDVTQIRYYLKARGITLNKQCCSN